MAGAQHNPSRRALLGAAVALPLVGAEGRWTPDRARGDGEGSFDTPVRQAHRLLRMSGNEERWRRLAAAFDSAAAAVAEVERRSAAADRAGKLALEEEYGERLDAMYAALRRLLRAPAPDLAAFAAKIELMVDHEVATLTGGEACLAAIRRDARRLAAGAG